jgi:hypothetical protein
VRGRPMAFRAGMLCRKSTMPDYQSGSSIMTEQ